MFRITQNPSSGSDNLYLIEITYNGSIEPLYVISVSIITARWSELSAEHKVG